MDTEIIFFLVAAIIAAVSKLAERSKRIRQQSVAQQKKREGRERLELIPSTPEPPKPLVQEVAVRPMREPRVRPPRRTRRVVAASKPATVHHAPKVDTSFVSRLRSNPQALREAIMLREILGPPVAMRGFRFPRR